MEAWPWPNAASPSSVKQSEVENATMKHFQDFLDMRQLPTLLPDPHNGDLSVNESETPGHFS